MERLQAFFNWHRGAFAIGARRDRQEQQQQQQQQRHLEQRHLERKITEHPGFICGCSVSADGQYVAAGGGTYHEYDQYDTGLWLFETATGTVVQRFSGHREWIWGCAFFPDGSRIVSVSADATARVWSRQTGQCLLTFQEHRSTVFGCDVSSDNSMVATCGDDQCVFVWDADTGAVLRLLEGHTHCVNGCRFSADATLLITCSTDRTARVWDIAHGGRPLVTLVGHRDMIYSCAICPTDNRKALTSSQDGRARVWFDGKCILVITPARSHAARSCCFSADGRYVIVSAYNSTVTMWDATSGHLCATFLTGCSRIYCCAAASDGSRVVASCQDGSLYVWTNPLAAVC